MRLTFYLDTPGDRAAALERRDQVTAALAELGIRVSMTDDGTYVYLVDAGIPTLGDRLTVASGGVPETPPPPLEARPGYTERWR